MTEPLTPEELAALRQFDTPTVSNAIETFNLRPRNEGFMSPEIRCLFPELGVMLGYACTAKIVAERPPEEGTAVSREEYWRHVLTVPAPRVVVVQDLDDPPAIGSLWGEVNANIHRALGCVGCVTNGGVRDLDEVRQLGFHFFAAAPIVSHAYVHLVEFGTPVKVGGVWVKPGDLLHADQHGVLLIPLEIARDLPEACCAVQERERPLIELCQSPGFTLEKLSALLHR
ncbi:MAG TPA: RraA family protein [Armatimonadetes bacterium]|nr:RraA family protein [Armatimonadota bacterium]